MSTPPAIRKATEADLEAALAVLARWNMAPRPPTPECPDPERSGLELDHTFVAVLDGRVVGVASYLLLEEHRAETASLAVDPSCRGLGIGHRLQTARLHQMKARGITRVRTETDRPETVSWYVRHFGYRVVGSNPKKHAFSLEGVDRWTVLELDLNGWQPS